MSPEPISLSPDLTRLREEGFDIAVKSGHLVIGSIPYVTPKREVAYGTLVTPLSLAGDVTTRPPDHVVMFAGEAPCHRDGCRIDRIIPDSTRREIAPGLWIDFTFSSKPPEGYADYYEKMTAYVRILVAEAKSIDETVTATPFRLVETSGEEHVFRYTDTASSRAGISTISEKLAIGRISIIGLGGTGSYILDLVAKTPVREIHLFDGDRSLQHNAFRSPGAPSADELRKARYKVDVFADVYSKMRRGIHAHAYFIDEAHLADLDGSDFVFLSFDGGSIKRALIQRLEQTGIPYIDVGMGLYEVDGSLGGQLRLVARTATHRIHVGARSRIPFAEPDANDEYSQNIQIADLNALNASLAVIKWKKLAGFYQDLEREHFSAYQVNGNCLINEDLA